MTMSFSGMAIALSAPDGHHHQLCLFLRGKLRWYGRRSQMVSLSV
ncbi:MAG: hypothetical protein SAK29_39810 [Scytonema sp. PMC 1069.18]|nr:hypothetical protein [Scytonema sp. PMC 1069.18]MEC4887098.1 hypothetical protein [Scytonema sp. PMC 1070.18]